jgi:hypothetical protein
MGKIIIHTKPDKKIETLKTLIKLQCDYHNYLTDVFSPVWGFDRSITKGSDTEESDQMGSSGDGDHPFFA